MRKHRQEKKQMLLAERERLNEIDISETSGYESQNSSFSERLIVRLPNARRNGPRKRLSKALSSAHREIKNLEEKNNTLQGKLKTAQRSIQRIRYGRKKDPMTPRRRTEKILKEAGIQKSQRAKIRKHLVFSNVIVDQIKYKMMNEKDRKKKNNVLSTIAGKILLKYKCLTKLSKETLLTGKNFQM